MMRLVRVPGLVAVEYGVRLQDECAKRWAAHGGAALLLQHAPTYTLGRKAWDADVARLPFPAVRVSRGGAVVFHGPGQWVVYVVRQLAFSPGDRPGALHRHADDLLRVAEHAAASLNVALARKYEPGDFHTGLFTPGGEKAAFVGFGLSPRLVSRHGLALNVCADLAPFGNTDVCGVRGAPVANAGGDMAGAGAALVSALSRVYGPLVEEPVPAIDPSV